MNGRIVVMQYARKLRKGDKVATEDWEDFEHD